MSKHLLVIAYHYPPIQHSSGVHRTVNFAGYLPEYGWIPAVLTVHPRAYAEKSPVRNVREVATAVHRAFTLDTSRHLSIMGRYPKFLALPDRWTSWCVGAIPYGLWLIRKYKPEAIFSTYPIATAHLIGYALHKITGLPWISDFRDPMTDTDYPSDPAVKASYEWIEERTIHNSTHSIFTTPDSMKMYLDKYRDLDASHCAVITNGYDEEAFRTAEQQRPARQPAQNGRPLVLIHSGTLYRSERDPLPFFDAVAVLAKAGRISPELLQIRLRATGDDVYYRNILEQSGIEKIIRLEDPVTYDKAIAEMLDADGLLLFQAANCNHQIPAKAYEYIRARRPVLTLTDPSGNTAALMREAGLYCITRIDSPEEIRQALVTFIEQVRTGSSNLPSDDIVMRYSRRNKTGELANILDFITGSKSHGK